MWVAMTLASVFAGVAHAQNALQLTAVKPTVEKAILLYWASNTNEVYEIDCADQLNGNDDGTTAWTPLYTDYASHGTNTFIADDGNYDATPAIPHPKSLPMRFYRAVLTGTNDSFTNPTIAITSPVTGANLSEDITVTVSTDSAEFLTEVKLFVDGEEQWLSFDGTNFVVNTCEWPNGQHVLFATAKSVSEIEGYPYLPPATTGRAVSAYQTVTFTNLITRLDLSQPFFEPSEGQTQQVSAVFAANVDWTLQIQDVASNTVRTVTGSGGSMLFNWDGTGDGGVAIPDGLYTYFITAQTNDQPLSANQALDLSPALLASSISVPDSTTPTDWYPTNAKQAVQAGWDFYYMQPPPMPPIWTNGAWMSWEDVFGPEPLSQVKVSLVAQKLYSSPLLTASATTLDTSSPQPSYATPAYAGPTSQSTRGPKRKPRVGVKNRSGSFGICYKTYGTGFLMQEPRTGLIPPLQPVFVAIDNYPAFSSYIDWGSLASHKVVANGFATGMKIGGFKQKFLLADEQWSPNDIKKSSLGGNSLFNTCNFGLLLTHGCHATTPEIDGVKYTYFPLWDRTNGASYLRLSDMDFGSVGANGLRWMTLVSCNTLYPANVTSMANNSKLPDNGSLHLLLGCSTTEYPVPLLGIYYASNLVFDVTIWNSFVKAGQDSYAYAYKKPASHTFMTNSVSFRVMGLDSCIGDGVHVYNDPDYNTTFRIIDQNVFTPQ